MVLRTQVIRPVKKAVPSKHQPVKKTAPARPATPPTRPIRAVMSVKGYGAISLHVTSLTFGMHIISSESQSRLSKAMYVTAMTSDSFGLSVACYSQEEYAHLGEFIRGYGNRAASGSLGVARVQIPKFGFDRTGIPSGARFGENVATLAYRMEIGFVGARDLVAASSTDVTLVSNVLGGEILNAIHHDPQAAYYYPSGSQLSGSGYGTDTLYDNPATAPAFSSELQDAAAPAPATSTTRSVANAE